MLKKAVESSPGAGLYTVQYKACWPDGSCHDGRFSFTIDRNKQSGFADLSNQKEVTIRMSQIKFSPMDTIIAKGTKVTWINDDDALHYVNTDSHPAHTHVPELNSQALNKGESYSYTFNQLGAFPYHCSAHASSMTGTVVVQ
jgi:plastocyanin